MDAETQELFDELKDLQREVEDSVREYERISALGPGHADYDTILEEHGGDEEKAQAEVATLAALHSSRLDELQEDEAAAMVSMSDAGSTRPSTWTTNSAFLISFGATAG